MIVKLPSRFCPICKGKGYSKIEKVGLNENLHVLVCPNITKKGTSEVMILYNFDKRIRKIAKKDKYGK